MSFGFACGRKLEFAVSLESLTICSVVLFSFFPFLSFLTQGKHFHLKWHEISSSYTAQSLFSKHSNLMPSRANETWFSRVLHNLWCSPSFLPCPLHGSNPAASSFLFLMCYTSLSMECSTAQQNYDWAEIKCLLTGWLACYCVWPPSQTERVNLFLGWKGKWMNPMLCLYFLSYVSQAWCSTATAFRSLLLCQTCFRLPHTFFIKGEGTHKQANRNICIYTVNMAYVIFSA